MNIVIIGTGYVGLVSGTCFAEFGLRVICVDKDETKIGKLNQGIIPLYEPGLEELLIKNIKEKRLSFTSSIAEAVSKSEVIFLAVGTPTNMQDGTSDLTDLYQAINELKNHINPGSLIVIKSTVPPGTTSQVSKMVADWGKNIEVANNPEFLREGFAVQDFMHPNRVITGCNTDKAKERFMQIYNVHLKQNIPVLFTSLQTSEMIKYASNSFLATKIAFINEMSNLCEKIGADVEEVAHGMGLDDRIGAKFLKAGPGFGGSCFPKDLMALARLASDQQVPSHILQAVIKSNDDRQSNLAKRIIDICDGSVQGKKIACLGVTFKANTDDIRFSPALTIYNYLNQAGAIINAYDPAGMDHAKKIYGDKFNWFSNSIAALDGAEAIVIITEWPEFQQIDFAAVKSNIKNAVIIDYRNILDEKLLTALGYKYYCIGK